MSHAHRWTADEIRRVGYKVADLIADHIAGLPERPVFDPVPPEAIERFMNEPVPAQGTAPDAILEDFRTRVAPWPFGNGHPRFWGWVNSPPAMMGVFAEALAAAMNPSVAGGNHAAVYVERQVLAWFKTIVGFPDDSMGLLVSGGSMATLTALAVARHLKAGTNVRQAGLQQIAAPLVIYMSAEGHSCIRKAAELMGIGSDFVRAIPVDAAFRMDVGALARAVAADRAKGLRPIAVAASAGTVNTGAIDPLASIAELCAREDLWLHVDAAYGGPAILSKAWRDALDPMRLADSLALDPHKWLYVPVEAGLVLVRDAAAMRDAFSLVPPYIRSAGTPTGVMGLPWLSEYGFQQTRGFRALKVWMAMKSYGTEGYADAIERNLELATHLAARVRAIPQLELIEPTSLTIVCFRYVPDRLRGREAELNAFNQRLLERLQLGGEAFVSSTILQQRFVLRACIVNHRSGVEDIDALVDVVLKLGSELGRSARL